MVIQSDIETIKDKENEIQALKELIESDIETIKDKENEIQALKELIEAEEKLKNLDKQVLRLLVPLAMKKSNQLRECEASVEKLNKCQYELMEKLSEKEKQIEDLKKKKVEQEEEIGEKEKEYKQRMKEEMETFEKLKREELMSKENELVNAAYVINGQKDELGDVKKKLHQCWGILYCLLFAGVVLSWLNGHDYLHESNLYCKYEIGNAYGIAYAAEKTYEALKAHTKDCHMFLFKESPANTTLLPLNICNIRYIMVLLNSTRSHLLCLGPQQMLLYLPSTVLGNGPKTTDFGTPINRHLGLAEFQYIPQLDAARSLLLSTPGYNVTNANGDSPHFSSGLATTDVSSIVGCEYRAFSNFYTSMQPLKNAQQPCTMLVSPS
ncbi:hypothetical protein L195_g004257 [Trifolium pratense]|uniref:Uncharacterized protein n=1 Tax=Trifolium pratense TaxID=57577 RepID=A0A2K3NXL3_TRIPR|nr:hypothetical protein L195_g004257 [Trifolium pratense]